jgi:hypothetical protein
MLFNPRWQWGETSQVETMSVILDGLFWLEGASARQDGEPRNSNPHPPDSDAYGLWFAGYDDAGAAERFRITGHMQSSGVDRRKMAQRAAGWLRRASDKPSETALAEGRA